MTDLKRNQRRHRLLELLSARGATTARKLAEELGASRMTIYRDIRELGREKRLRPVRGGAAAADFRSFDPGWDVKSSINAAAKRKIAKAAAERFLSEDMRVIVESGSTAAALLDHIVSKPNCLVFSNCVETLAKCKRLGFRTGQAFALPGTLKTDTLTFVGAAAIDYIGRLPLDLCVISATGLNVAGELQDPDPMEIAVKQAMAATAKQTILLLDRSKFGKTSLFPTMALEKISACITDRPLEETFARIFAKSGVEVVVAQ